MNIIERITGLKISTGVPARERGIAFPVGSVPRSRIGLRSRIASKKIGAAQ